MSEQENTPEESTITLKKSTFNYILVGFVIVLVIASFSAGMAVGSSGKATVTGAVVQQQQQQPAAQQPTAQQPAADSRVQVSADDDPVLGNANAKVTIIEFSDFQCPFCERFYTQSEKSIVTDYVNTGKVKLVFRDFPLGFHPNARPAANAAECANEQGKFWEYHNKLFENQASLGDANYKQWAADLGLDTAKFNSCYDAKKYDSEISKDVQDGSAAGVSGTPTSFIGSPAKGFVRIVGAQPYSSIKAVIDAELSSA